MFNICEFYNNNKASKKKTKTIKQMRMELYSSSPSGLHAPSTYPNKTLHRKEQHKEGKMRVQTLSRLATEGIVYVGGNGNYTCHYS